MVEVWVKMARRTDHRARIGVTALVWPSLARRSQSAGGHGEAERSEGVEGGRRVPSAEQNSLRVSVDNVKH
jgi:hypothetical protein